VTDNDRDLRERFAALRREEEAQAPGFMARPVPGPRQVWPWSPGALTAAATCLAAIAAVALWLGTASHRMRQEPGKPVASITEWKPQTDFLLETPGRELLGTVPAIGNLQVGGLAPSPHRKNSQVRKHVSP